MDQGDGTYICDFTKYLYFKYSELCSLNFLFYSKNPEKNIRVSVNNEAAQLFSTLIIIRNVFLSSK